MRLLLIRHLESEKNRADAFSSVLDDEDLTHAASQNVAVWAKPIVSWIGKVEASITAVHCAASRRAERTADGIATRLRVPVLSYEALRSPHVGPVAGRSAEMSDKCNPEFMEQLRLYRKGLFNAHHFAMAGMEPQSVFENRVEMCVDEIVQRSSGLVIVVAHRAALTAVLLATARKFYGYPQGFTGYVELSLGHMSLLTSDESGVWKIVHVNISGDELERTDETGVGESEL